MKTITINGVEVKIGSRVRFVNDKDLYTGVEGVIKPVISAVYTVRDINEIGGFLLEEIKNIDYEWYSPSGELESVAEPGFANWRFEPAKPISKKKVVQIEILPQFEETLYRPIKRKILEKDIVKDIV
jgi:hypothetical protein